MPLPIVGQTMSAPRPVGIGAAPAVAAPIAGGTNNAFKGHANWAANVLQFANAPVDNYWYLPQAGANDVNWCTLPMIAAGQFYVVSDNFGGCELHVLHNALANQYAVMHVFRGGGAVAAYVLSPGWALISTKRSQQIALIGGVPGTNWSVTFIDSTVAPVVVQTNFIRINGTLDVTHVSNGNAAYLPAAPAPVIPAVAPPPVVVPVVAPAPAHVRCVVM